MPREVVQVHGQITRDADEVWANARDFCAPWHPWIASMQRENGPMGQIIRAFRVQGEDTLYREAQTYLSDSDRVLGYTHLAGITDVVRYDARLTVTPIETGCAVTWRAEVSSPIARLAAICEGTRAVFKAGIAALATLPAPAAEVAPASPPPAPITEITIHDLPRLGLSLTPDLGEDRLCIFLHGIGGNGRNWRAQLAAIGPNIRSVALDLRGYGSSTLGPAQSTIDDYCEDILRAARHFGARRLVLVGLSYGSWIATSFAMRHGDMLDGLVLAGGCTGMSEAGPEEREAFRLSREVPLNAGQVPADFAPAVVKVLAGPQASEAVQADLLASMAAISAATYRDALVCFTNPLERFDFAKLTMPVLMMTGEHDRLAPPPEIRGVAGRIWDMAPQPNVRFEVIKDAGHVCNLEAPDQFNRHLTAFIQGLPK
jgi:pimeloyl-ACP methyl ester carboxylesterase